MPTNALYVESVYYCTYRLGMYQITVGPHQTARYATKSYVCQ